jgi:histidine triad (HIT) family protein
MGVQMADCVFCKIVSGELESAIVAESEHVLAIKNIQPVAPVHYLIIPRIHIKTMTQLGPSHEATALAMCAMVRELAETLDDPQAYNIIINNGEEAGQSVFHLHWHFLSGRNIYEGGAFKF